MANDTEQSRSPSQGTPSDSGSKQAELQWTFCRIARSRICEGFLNLPQIPQLYRAASPQQLAPKKAPL